jgi:hypothetical protein
MALDTRIIIELEYTKSLIDINATIESYPVWRYLLWSMIPPTFSWLRDGYSHSELEISNIVIDQIEYNLVTSVSACLDQEMSYYQGDTNGKNLYIHFKNHWPPAGGMSLRIAISVGFTDKGIITTPRRLVYPPKVLAVPTIEEKADSLNYSKMQFVSGKIDLLNTDGFFDSLSAVFGNEVRILSGLSHYSYDQFKKLAQFYVANASITKSKLSLSGKDKRERAAYKAPVNVYTEQEYPYMVTAGYPAEDIEPRKSKFIGKIKSNSYGYCFEVQGVCINEYQIYNDVATGDMSKNTSRRFRFCDHLTTVFQVEVKMSGDTWYTLSQTQLNPWTIDWTEHDDGILKINWIYLFPPLPNGEPDPSKSVYEVRIRAICSPQPDIPGIPQNTPGAIILAILRDYGNIASSEKFFNLEEMRKNLGSLPRIGLTLNKSKNVYDWIEQLQNSSLMGFQFYNDYDRFSCRLDSSNRNETFEIRGVEILNKDEIEIDYNAENYATFAKIQYLYKSMSDEYESVLIRDYENQILDNYRIPKEYGDQAPTLLTEEADAELKGHIVMNEYVNFRPIIRGVKVFGEKWFDLKFYDIGYIDVSETRFAKDSNFLINLMSQAAHAKQIQENGEELDHEMIALYNKDEDQTREFAGSHVRVKILRKVIDLEKYEVTFDLQICERNPKIPAYFGGSALA